MKPPVRDTPGWWVVESSDVDGIQPGTVLRFAGTEMETVDPSLGDRGVDSRLVRVVQLDVWAVEGTPMTVSRTDRLLSFRWPDRSPRSVALRPARGDEAALAERGLARHPAREEACKRMDACLEVARADQGIAQEPMGHNSLAFCEQTRLGVGGRYRALKKSVPAPCTNVSGPE